MDAIRFDIKGIKCDNPACGWRDMSVAFDMDKFLNAPCPACGSNLFTQKDYDAMKRMFARVAVVNRILRPFVKLLARRGQTKEVRQRLEMDGSGKVYRKDE